MGIGAWIISAILFVVVFLYEKKEYERKSHQEWIVSERNKIKRISHEFENFCIELTDKYLEKHNNLVCRNMRVGTPRYQIEILYDLNTGYRRSIGIIKDDFSCNFEQKYSCYIGKFRANGYPSYLIDEFNEQLSKIEDSYIYIANLIQKQVFEIDLIYKK